MLKRLLFVPLMAFVLVCEAGVRLSPFGPKPAFFDSNGDPLSGGKVYFYAAGSTTPLTTYTDSTGGVANTNPVVLNSRGEPANEVWFTEGLSYKAVLKTSADVTIWTVDNLTGINDTTTSVDEWKASNLTPTYVSATSFTLSGDQTLEFHVGRRLKTTNSGGTVYSTITASAFAASTTVTVANDSGSLDAGLSAVSYSLLRSANAAVPQSVINATSWTFQLGVDHQGFVRFSADISPSQITGNQNDYNPSGLSTAAVLRLSTDASRNITGLAGGADGRVLKILNVGAQPIVLKTADAGSSAANRFLFDADITLQGDQGAVLWYDSTSSRWRSSRVTNGEYRSTQVFTASGTWTKPAGLKRVKVTVVGGGASGGGAPIVSGQQSAGTGGGGGGAAIKTIAASALGATETVTVGAGGAGSTGNGNAGGASSFGAHCSATGGGAGTAQGPAALVTPTGTGGTGGVGSGGDVNLRGGSGGWAMLSNSNNSASAGAGGNSMLGGMAAGGTANAGSAGGTAGSDYGGGSSGAALAGTAAALASLAGAGGIVIVEEFF